MPATPDNTSCSIIIQLAYIIFAALISAAFTYLFTRRHFKKTNRYNILSKAKESLISEKMRIIHEKPKRLMVGDVSVVQGVIENIKFLFNKVNLKAINTYWDEYYKNEHLRSMTDANEKDRKKGAIEALEAMIKIIEKHL